MTCKRESQSERGREDREEWTGTAAERQVAHQPEQHAAQLGFLAETEQHAHDGTRAGRHDYAGQQ